ncbi:MAG: hypothetical protein R3F15_07990 [Lysobacterales bacterium]
MARLRSFGTQLLLYSVGLLLAMGLLVTVLLGVIALEPSAEQMARSLAVLARAADERLQRESELGAVLQDAGAFQDHPGDQPPTLALPFAARLRALLAQRLERPVELRQREDGETVLWLPAQSDLAAIGLRYEPLRAPVARASLVLFGALAGLLMLAAWLAARWLIAPMRRLAQALPAMVAGGSAPPLGRQATREVSELADALSEAITRLREQSAAREVALAGISHDLRTPLMRMALQLQWLPAHPRLAEIEREIETMDALIAAGLELARAGRQEAPQWQPLGPVLARLLPDEPVWQRPEQIEWQVLAPPIALRRALDNLIQNALRHGVAPFVLDLQRSSAGLSICVSNALAEDTLPPPPSGTPAAGGLGLAIVEHLAASFDARLQRDYHDGQVRMSLLLPTARIRPQV